MTFKQPELPYAENALDPHISARTLQFHYGKHHAGYIKKLNDGIKDTKYADMQLEEIVLASAKSKDDIGIFRNAAQAWNHSFYWHCMKPDGGGAASGDIAGKIDEAFGSYDKFRKEFADAAKSEFGSGWAWLSKDESGALKITSADEADNPATDGHIPLLTCDVWEHAYYLDYQNRRPDYIEAFLDNLVNWDFVNTMLGASEFKLPFDH